VKNITIEVFLNTNRKLLASKKCQENLAYILLTLVSSPKLQGILLKSKNIPLFF
jgi:hypothetical protein